MNIMLLYDNYESEAKNSYMNKNEIIQDLNLDIIFKAMARDDKYIYKTVRNVMLSSLTDKRTIIYRQEITTDCIRNFESFNELYQLSVQTMEEIDHYKEASKRIRSSAVSNSISILDSLQILGILVRKLESVKEHIETVASNFESRGMQSFCSRLIEDYNVDFVEKIKTSIVEMNFLTEGGQISFSAKIGQGLKSKDLIVNDLSKADYTKRKNQNRVIELVKNIYYTLFKQNVILLNDDRITQDAREMESAGLVHILKIYQNFITNLMSFFEGLHLQMAYYVGCGNLHIRFTQLHIHTCMPNINNAGMKGFKFRGLYDMSMAIYNRNCPVTNDLDTDDLLLYLITGANQGGKSTYLRSIGIAQLLMQSGMFVPADYYCNSICQGIYTHFTRREDGAMNSGKLDEELTRMDRIISSITPGSMLLMNESFATTTEREGSHIAEDVVNALYENEVKVLMVTHLFEFTKTMLEKNLEKSIFLSAERKDDGTRTFRILKHEPERTSYGLDLYENIIGVSSRKELSAIPPTV